MSLRSVFVTIVIVWAVCAAPGVAQEKLGDLVASGGYDWIIGKWVATTDDGQKAQSNFDWALDKCVVLNDLRVGDFTVPGHHHVAAGRRGCVRRGRRHRGRDLERELVPGR